MYLDATQEFSSVSHMQIVQIKSAATPVLSKLKWHNTDNTLIISAMATVLLIACPIAFKTISFVRWS